MSKTITLSTNLKKIKLSEKNKLELITRQQKIIVDQIKNSESNKKSIVKSKNEISNFFEDNLLKTNEIDQEKFKTLNTLVANNKREDFAQVLNDTKPLLADDKFQELKILLKSFIENNKKYENTSALIKEAELKLNSYVQDYDEFKIIFQTFNLINEHKYAETITLLEKNNIKLNNINSNLLLIAATEQIKEQSSYDLLNFLINYNLDVNDQELDKFLENLLDARRNDVTNEETEAPLNLVGEESQSESIVE